MNQENSSQEPSQSPVYDRDQLAIRALEKVALEGIQEQRRARRWGIVFKTLGMLYLFVALLIFAGLFGGNQEIMEGPHTALVDLKGVIADGEPAGADVVVTGLRDAFEDKHTKGVILRINSPGGSPVQAGYINDEIYRLRAEHPDVPVYAVIEDMCASGGYYVAVAADKIFADKASTVGSIGVITSSFGFVEAMDKLGVERRVLTAGKNKAFLDPFSPMQATHKEHIQKLLAEIHAQFIETVKKGRGERLVESDDLFTGYIWTGEKAVQMGLVDGLGSAGYVAREVIGAEQVVDFTPREDVFTRLSERIGVTFARSVMGVFNEAPMLR